VQFFYSRKDFGPEVGILDVVVKVELDVLEVELVGVEESETVVLQESSDAVHLSRYGMGDGHNKFTASL